MTAATATFIDQGKPAGGRGSAPNHQQEHSNVVLSAHHSKRQGARERREGDDGRHSQILDEGEPLEDGGIQQSGCRRECNDEAQRRRLLQDSMHTITAVCRESYFALQRSVLLQGRMHTFMAGHKPACQTYGEQQAKARPWLRHLTVSSRYSIICK